MSRAADAGRVLYGSAAKVAASVTSQLRDQGSIRSLGTERNYRQCLRQCGEWLHEQYGKTATITTMSVKTAYSYLDAIKGEVSQKTLDQHRQAVQMVLRDYSHKLEQGRTLTVIKSEKETQQGPRAYTREQVQEVAAHQTERNAIATEIAYSAGLRAHELLTLERYEKGVSAEPMHREQKPSEQLYSEKFRGREGVSYVVTGKGGHVREVRIPAALAEKLETRRLDTPRDVTDRKIHYTQHYDISGGNAWSRSFSRASEAAFGWSTGAHGLRHAYAQERMSELQRSGFTKDGAQAVVSLEMGHYRPEITATYLR